MSTSAVASALNGLSIAQAYYDSSVQRATSDSVSASPTDDIVAGYTSTTAASEAVAINVAVLRQALGTEGSLVDLFA